ncbi:TonB-dependent receptor [Tellurirhabdus bombi]|uniref:TonB-dependent receptor n=1 Tax=Tellurirhabdus bombi TaxID=2907205 RepID=UPI001F26C3A6|nr:TonB-dependent receptor [Tellurirhabdus bombi]
MPLSFFSSNSFRHSAGLTISFLSILSAAQAQPIPSDSTRERALDPVVVTATRYETRKELIPQKINIITQQDIALTPALDLTDIVKKTAAVNVIQYPSLSSGIGIRGFRPQFSGLNQRTLLLIDGRPAGVTNLSLINLNGIERIEVLKGPASSLYGSQAMGGVINVITRRSSGETKGNAFVEYGSFQTLQAGLNAGGNLSKRLDYDLSFAYFERSKDYKIGKNNWFRDGFDFTTARRNYANKPAEDIDDRKDDGQRRPFTQMHYYSGALRLGYQISRNWRVDVRGERFLARDVESPGDITYGTTEAGKKDVDRAAGEVSLTGQIGQHQPSLKVFTAEENSGIYTLNASGKPVIPYRSSSTGNNWQGIQVKDVWRLGNHSLIVGYDYLNASTESRRWSDATTERAPSQPDYALISSAFFAQALLRFDRLTVQPGVRYDNITFQVKDTPLLTTYQSGKKTNPFVSPSLGLTYELLPALRLKGTVGRAFVTPDAFSVAGYSEVRSSAGKISVIAGNPDLTNESSLSWDLGLSFSKPQVGLSANVTYFSTRVQNRIARVVSQVNEVLPNKDVIVSRTSYVNAADSEISGLETELTYDFGALSQYKYSLKVILNATSLFNATEVIVGTDASRIERDVYNVAKTNGNYGIEYDNLRKLRLRLSGRYVGPRKDTDFTDVASPEIEYPNYAVLDFAASYQLTRSHSLTLQVNNLTDENYYEKRGYNLPGRAISARYTLTF